MLFLRDAELTELSDDRSHETVEKLKTLFSNCSNLSRLQTNLEEIQQEVFTYF